MLTTLSCQALQDGQLLATMRSLAEKERTSLAEFLVHLMEVDKRKLYAEGYSSLFAYMTKELKYSESCAGKRIFAARLAQRWLMVLPLVATGALNLSSLCQLGPHLKEDGDESLLKEAEGKSTRELEKLLAVRYPKPDSKDSIRRLPLVKIMAAPVVDASAVGDRKIVAGPVVDASGVVDKGQPQLTLTPQVKVSELKPISATRVKVSFTGSEALQLKIEKAKALLSHKYPEGHLEELMEEAFDALLKKIDPTQQPERKTPKRQVAATKTSRYIPKAVRKAVWLRDEGRCTHISPQGLRCCETRFLEMDHIKAFALGGSSRKAEDLRLLCRAHNQKHARESFGAEFMARKLHAARHAKQRQPAAADLQSVMAGQCSGG